MYVLDTDTLSLLFAGNSRILGRQASIRSSEIAITIVTWIEVLQGRFDFLLKAGTVEELLRAQGWLDETLRSLARVETVITIEAAAAGEFARLRGNKKLKRIGRGDLLIAAISLAERRTLVTRNVKHFRLIPGLRLENWAD